MHWKQREMLFEQREALKEQTGTARKRKSGTGKKGNEIARKGGLGTPMGGDTPKSPPGKSAKGRRFEDAHGGPSPRPAGGGGPRPFPKKRQPDERIAGKKPEDKLARGRKLRKAKRQDEGKHLKKEGMHSKKEGMHSKKKAESHCEAYAEAYVRGVEAALRESRR